jgi:hypothetical protein
MGYQMRLFCHISEFQGDQPGAPFSGANVLPVVLFISDRLSLWSPSGSQFQEAWRSENSELAPIDLLDCPGRTDSVFGRRLLSQFAGGICPDAWSVTSGHCHADFHAHSFQAGSLSVGDQMHVLPLVNFGDCDRARPAAFIHRPGCLHVLSHERHEPLALILVGH